MPNEILSTPHDKWGDVIEYHTPESMWALTVSLEEVGIDADMSDCETWKLLKDLGDGQGVYERERAGRIRDVRGFLLNPDGSLGEKFIVGVADYERLGIE